MAEAVKPAFFVPATIKADVLFRNMRLNHQVMAVVLDEYGGVEGIVTLNDLIEQLVGDLSEEPPEELVSEPHIEQTGENSWIIIGNIELLEIEHTLEVGLGCEEVDTFTGLVFDALGMVPDDGNQNIELDFRGLHIHIARIEDHQIAYAKVTKPEKSNDEISDE